MLRPLLLACTLLLAALAAPAQAPCNHPLNDAWFTGPMLANTAASPPRGHAFIEPYLFDVHSQSTFAPNGTRQPAPHANSYNSLTYVIYGLTDRLALGVLPQLGYNTIANQPSSSSPALADLTLILQRRLTTLRPCGHLPILSLAVEQTFPNGAYDNLNTHPYNALGQGVYTTTPALFSQMYFWLPNHRILRTRLDLYDAISTTASVHGVSVYNTSASFRGTAHPGNTLTLDAAVEYSLTRRLALATDAAWRTSANTRICDTTVAQPNTSGTPITSPTITNSGSSTAWAIAPAVEYSWRPWIGVMLGLRLYPAAHNTPDTLTPAIALSIYR